MPIYEYKCEKCNTDFDVFIKSVNNQEEIHCSNCKSLEVKKIVSRVNSSIPGSPSKFYDSTSELSGSGGGCGCGNGTCGI